MLAVSPATPADVAALTDLLEELDGFYGATEFAPPEQRAAQIQNLLFRPVPVASVVLARDETRLVGLASYSFLWPAAGVTHSLYLKELYVAGAERGRGVGRALMEHLTVIAREQGCSRIEWTTERDNDAARAFYERLGFAVEASKVFYRVGIR